MEAPVESGVWANKNKPVKVRKSGKAATLQKCINHQLNFYDL